MNAHQTLTLRKMVGVFMDADATDAFLREHAELAARAAETPQFVEVLVDAARRTRNPDALVSVMVTDRRGKFPPRTYQVAHNDPEFLVYGPAIERFIMDNGIKPRGPSQRMSAYYARFWAEVVAR